MSNLQAEISRLRDELETEKYEVKALQMAYTQMAEKIGILKRTMEELQEILLSECECEDGVYTPPPETENSMSMYN